MLIWSRPLELLKYWKDEVLGWRPFTLAYCTQVRTHEYKTQPAAWALTRSGSPLDAVSVMVMPLVVLGLWNLRRAASALSGTRARGEAR